jgi:hypothetical protein
MFLIPICGSKTLRARLPRRVAAVCAGGVLAMAFVLVNACGYGFYRKRRAAKAS